MSPPPTPPVPTRARRLAQVAVLTVLGGALLLVASVLLNGGRLPRSATGWLATGGLLVGLNVLAALWERGGRWLLRERRPAPVVPPERHS